MNNELNDVVEMNNLQLEQQMQVADDADYWKQVAQKKELEIQSIKVGEQFKLNLENVGAMSDFNEADEKSFEAKGYDKLQE